MNSMNDKQHPKKTLINLIRYFCIIIGMGLFLAPSIIKPLVYTLKITEWKNYDELANRYGSYSPFKDNYGDYYVFANNGTTEVILEIPSIGTFQESMTAL